MTAEFSINRGARPIVADPSGRPETVEADAVVAFLTEGGVANGAIAGVDRATGGLISRLIAAGEITGKRCECVPLLAPPGLRAGQLVVVGLGKREEVDAGTLYRAAASATRLLSARPRSRVALVADGWWPARQIEQAVAGGCIGAPGSARPSGSAAPSRPSTAVRSWPTA
jgi:hypothetical protein